MSSRTLPMGAQALMALVHQELGLGPPREHAQEIHDTSILSQMGCHPARPELVRSQSPSSLAGGLMQQHERPGAGCNVEACI